MRQRIYQLAIATLFLAACQDSNAPMPEAESIAPGESNAPGDPSLSNASTTPEWIYGVDDFGYLIRFRADQPDYLRQRVRITGTGGEKVVGIDFRPSAVAPANPGDIGKLYGITRTRIYEINPRNVVARNGQPLTFALRGNFFGAGFNPTVDRFRSHSHSGQNLRLNVDDGATTRDTALAYRAGDPNFGKDPAVAATGYTNSDNDPNTLTELYAIDARQDVLVELETPNGGQLTTVGGLRVGTSTLVGFDIPGTQSGGSRFGYASLTSTAERDTKSGSGLYRVDLDTGRATRIGGIGGHRPLVSIAIAP